MEGRRKRAAKIPWVPLREAIAIGQSQPKSVG